MSDDLITRLRALAAELHHDVSVAVDAVIEIEWLRAEVIRLHSAHETACAGGDLLRAEVERLRAENKRLAQYLTWIRDQGGDVVEPWCAERARVALLGGKQ